MKKQATDGFWLSPQQQRLCSQRQTGRCCVVVSLEGSLSPDRLRAALRELVSRHEALRTVYQRLPGMKFPFQVVLDADELAWETTDLTGLAAASQNHRLEELVRQARYRAFSFEHGPVVNACLAILDRNRSVLILSLPALCCDAQSLQTVAHELGAVYAGQREQLAKEPLRYVQFAQWRCDLLKSDDDDARAGKSYWQKSMGAVVLDLTLPQEAEKAETCSLESLSCTLEPSTVNKLDALGVKHNVSGSNVLLAAWQTLLWRLTGQSNFVVRVLFSGRKYDELRGAVGLFDEMLPIQARIGGNFRFTDLLEHVRDAVGQAAEWQEYFAPSEDTEAGPSVAFDYEEFPAEQEYGGVRFRVLRQEGFAERYKLKLSGRRRREELGLEFHYDSSRLDRETVERWGSCFQTLLAAAVENPEALVSQLPVLSEGERRLLVQWNETRAEYPEQRCIQELFEIQAERTPGRAAVQCEEQQLSYGELNERANQLAHYLRRMGVGPDALVGLCVERGVQMLVAVLGILKAGGAYVPLSADHPQARLAQQLAGAVALVTEQKLLGQMPEFGGETICLDRDGQRWSKESRSNPEVQTKAEHLAYVIYTSGSTGVPKGVGVRHRNLVNYTYFMGRRLELEKYEEGLQFATVSSLSADLGNTCIYPALISGGCLHVIGEEVAIDGQRLGRYMSEHPVDVLKIVPSHLMALLDSGGDLGVLPRKYLVVGGETLKRQLMERIGELGGSCEVVNHYGPTETTVGSLTLRLQEYDWKGATAHSIPIGRPIANTRVYILDGQGQRVPIGVVGELYIAGAGVAAGYIHQAERTAERFLADPFGDDPQGKMYRTGDLARYLRDGNVEFLGRVDDQVKIRGFRIELGEIESVLGRHAAVKQAVVLAREDERGEKRLVGYVVGQGGQTVNIEELRQYLKSQLPDYMVPTAMVVLAKLPLTSNGKIDRQALPAPEQLPSNAYVAPSTPTEQMVAAIWSEVLRRDGISAQEDFFQIGGHSLLATQVISRIRRSFSIDLSLRTLFESPTICGLAQVIDDTSTVQYAESQIIPVAREMYRHGGRVKFEAAEKLAKVHHLLTDPSAVSRFDAHLSRIKSQT